MAWIKPKTDWTSEYKADYADFNRICGNLNRIKTLANELFADVPFFLLDEEKTNISMIYAREMNSIEESLETLNQETYGFEIGEKQTFKANGSTPLWSEFNRIESAVLLLYETLVAHKKALKRLSFTLGGQKGIKV